MTILKSKPLITNKNYFHLDPIPFIVNVSKSETEREAISFQFMTPRLATLNRDPSPPAIYTGKPPNQNIVSSFLSFKMARLVAPGQFWPLVVIDGHNL